MQATRALTALLVLAFALTLASTASARHSNSGADRSWLAVSRVAILREGIGWQRTQAWKWQDAVGVRRSPAAYHEKRETSVPYLRWIVSLWNVRRDRAFQTYKRLLRTRPAHYDGWVCIHRQEGAWYSDTGNGFYNGLQMTWGWLGIIRGNPNNYTPMQIMQAAEKGYRDSGYSRSWMAGQWPNTYPPCARLFA